MKEIEKKLEAYYRTNLQNFGPGAKGVGWKSEEAQHIRFTQLCKVFEGNRFFSVNDLGCGTGDFFGFLLSEKIPYGSYTGYDMLGSMTELAAKRYNHAENAGWIEIRDSSEIKEADYTIASGIFNLKYNIPEKEWMEYIQNTLKDMNRKSKSGFAFNMLTVYSDKELMRDDLYYSDPCFFFDFCKKNFSRNVALLHDYFEYDFTILVKK